ncbi:Eaa protein [Salmonella enterica]|nr:Eaa protein [Salmonella enterica]
MTTITRERAQEIFLGNGPEPTASEQRELARIALASLEAETVAWTDAEELRDLRTVGFCEMFTVEPVSKDADMYRVIPLYTAPPAPVAAYSVFEDFWSTCKHPYTQDDELKDFSWGIWNACRDAMLNGGKS